MKLSRRVCIFLLLFISFSKVLISQEISIVDANKQKVLNPTFVDINAGLIGINSGEFEWIDMDQDGDFDIFGSGLSNSLNDTAITYINDGNIFNPVSTGIISLNDAAIDYGDFDNDQDVDLVILGFSDQGQCRGFIYRNNGNNTFTDINAGIEGLVSGDSKWGDFDNDGDLDLVTCGIDDVGVPKTYIYENKGNEQFIAGNYGLVGLSGSSCDWGDYDNDNDLDLLICGSDYLHESKTLLYRNDLDGFTVINTNITNTHGGEVDWGDYDDDGDLDVLISGQLPTPFVKVFRNDGNNDFIDIDAGFFGVQDGSLSWGDINNDGCLDVTFNGTKSSNTYTKIYLNNGNGEFMELSSSIENLGYFGTIRLADFDGDNDLDVLICGENNQNQRKTIIYRNDVTVLNNIPSIPSQCFSSTNNDRTTLFWNAASDNETPPNGLTYNIRIGTAPGISDIRPPMSDIGNGERFISQEGYVSDTSWFIDSLPNGVYYWSVQSIDNCFKGSSFSSESTFTIGPQPCPGISSFNYGGQEYNTILIGDQCWMKENLNVGTKIDGNQNQTDNSVIEKYCYDNQETNCDAYGGLYQWNEIMDYKTDTSNRGICPDGWHIPTIHEWDQLVNFLGGDLVAGGKLKEPGLEHWNSPNTGASNISGFTGLGSGHWDFASGFFDRKKYHSNFWTTSSYSPTQIIIRDLHYNNETCSQYYYEKSYGFPVRCIKDTVNIPMLNPGFSAIPRSGIFPLTVQFSDTSGGIPNSWQWDFQNDGIIDSYEQNPSYTFSDTGKYDVKLIVADGIHIDSIIKSDYIIVYEEYDTCPGISTIEYGGQVYNTVLIGNQCWMKENLNIGQRIDGSEDQKDNGVIEKYCHFDENENCEKYGGLYQWSELMNYIGDTALRGICPEGWHVPTDWEWKVLEGTVDSQYDVGDSEWDGEQWRGYDAGKNLKTNYGWYLSGNGVDLYDFSAISKGCRQYDGAFIFIGYAYYWTSSIYSSDYSWRRMMGYLYDDINRMYVLKNNGFNVRCIYNNLIYQYTIQTNSIPQQGGNTYGSGQYFGNFIATINATENPGYQFIHWKEADTIVTTQQEYTFAVNSDRTFYAHFEQLTYNITTSADPLVGGTTSGDGTYFYNDEVTVEAMPEPDWNFLNWTENSVIVSSDEEYTFNVTGSRNLVAHFTQELIYNVLLTPNPDSGGITIGSGNYAAGSDVTIKARPNDGWEFLNWTENSSVISTDTLYTFQVNTDRSIVANFNQLTYDLTLNAIPGEGGTTSGAGTYYYDDQAEISADPNEHWSFIHWKEADTVLSGSQTLSITIKSSRTIDAIFEEDPKYDVTVTAQPDEGGGVLGDSSYYYGDYATVKAIANQGWQFIEWKVGGTQVATTQEFTFEVTEEVDLVASFESLGTLNLAIENSGDDTICQGVSITIQCLPSGGSPPYEFNWTSNPTGASCTSDAISDEPDVSTTYIITVSDALLNTKRDSITITVNPSPPANIVGKGNPPYMLICVDSGYAYQWYFNEEMLEGETKQFYYPGPQGLEVGPYFVNVSNEDGCLTKSNVFEKSTKSGFEIWPNPNTGEFFVGISSDMIASNIDAKIRIIDLNGKVLEEFRIANIRTDKKLGYNFFIDRKGVFIAEFISSEQRMAKKVIVY